MSQIKKAHYQNNLEAREKISQRQKAYYENNPEARKYEKNRKLFRVFRKDTMEFIKEFEYQFFCSVHFLFHYLGMDKRVHSNPFLLFEFCFHQYPF